MSRHRENRSLNAKCTTYVHNIYECIYFFQERSVYSPQRLTKITKKSWFQLCKKYFLARKQRNLHYVLLLSLKRGKNFLCANICTFLLAGRLRHLRTFFSVGWNFYFFIPIPRLYWVSQNFRHLKADVDKEINILEFLTLFFTL